MPALALPAPRAPSQRRRVVGKRSSTLCTSCGWSGQGCEGGAAAAAASCSTAAATSSAPRRRCGGMLGGSRGGRVSEGCRRGHWSAPAAWSAPQPRPWLSASPPGAQKGTRHSFGRAWLMFGPARSTTKCVGPRKPCHCRGAAAHQYVRSPDEAGAAPAQLSAPVLSRRSLARRCDRPERVRGARTVGWHKPIKRLRVLPHCRRRRCPRRRRRPWPLLVAACPPTEIVCSPSPNRSSCGPPHATAPAGRAGCACGVRPGDRHCVCAG